MATSTDRDIKELKEILLEMRGDIKQIDENIKSLEIGQAKIEARLDEWKPSIYKISDLAEKVGELKNWRQIALIVLSTAIAAIMGWFLRGGKP